MRYLIDTHALIWWIDNDRRWPTKARAVISDKDNDIHVSAATAWEITTKHRLGTLGIADAFAADVEGSIRAERFSPLDVTMAQAELAGRLPSAHRDPFDRMLIAQALLDDLVLTSNEAVFDTFGVKRLWAA